MGRKLNGAVRVILTVLMWIATSLMLMVPSAIVSLAFTLIVLGASCALKVQFQYPLFLFVALTLILWGAQEAVVWKKMAQMRREERAISAA